MDRYLEKSAQKIRQEIEKSAQEVWQNFEKRWGYPVAATCKVAIEEGALSGICDSQGLEDLEGFLKDVSPLIIDALSKNPNRQPENITVSPRKRYKKPFERRLHLVIFVAERKQGNRIDWRRLSDEWNKERPDEPMTSKGFNAEYHRAKKDKAVQQEYAKLHEKEYATLIEELASHAEDSSLAREEIWVSVGRIALYQGTGALASTVQFTRIALSQSPPAKATEIPWER